MTDCSGNSCSSDSCGTETCTARPQFKWSEFLIAIVLWALFATIQSWPSMIVVSIAILTWLFGCYRTRAATGVVLEVIYTPIIFLTFWFQLIEGRPNVLQSVALLPLQSEMAAVFPSDAADWIAAAGVSSIFLGAVTLIRFYPKTQPGIFFVLMLLGWGRAIGWAAISFATSAILASASAF